MGFMTWKSASERRESSSPDIVGIIGNASVAITGRLFPPSQLLEIFPHKFFLTKFVRFLEISNLTSWRPPDFREPAAHAEGRRHPFRKQVNDVPLTYNFVGHKPRTNEPKFTKTYLKQTTKQEKPCRTWAMASKTIKKQRKKIKK